MVGVYISMCVCGPLPTSGALQSGTGIGTDSGAVNYIIPSQKVYGQLIILTSLVRNGVLVVFLSL